MNSVSTPWGKLARAPRGTSTVRAETRYCTLARPWDVFPLPLGDLPDTLGVLKENGVLGGSWNENRNLCSPGCKMPSGGTAHRGKQAQARERRMVSARENRSHAPNRVCLPSTTISFCKPRQVSDTRGSRTSTRITVPHVWGGTPYDFRGASCRSVGRCGGASLGPKNGTAGRAHNTKHQQADARREAGRHTRTSANPSRCTST